MQFIRVVSTSHRVIESRKWSVACWSLISFCNDVWIVVSTWNVLSWVLLVCRGKRSCCRRVVLNWNFLADVWVAVDLGLLVLSGWSPCLRVWRGTSLLIVYSPVETKEVVNLLSVLLVSSLDNCSTTNTTCFLLIIDLVIWICSDSAVPRDWSDSNSTGCSLHKRAAVELVLHNNLSSIVVALTRNTSNCSHLHLSFLHASNYGLLVHAHAHHCLVVLVLSCRQIWICDVHVQMSSWVVRTVRRCGPWSWWPSSLAWSSIVNNFLAWDCASTTLGLHFCPFGLS